MNFRLLLIGIVAIASLSTITTVHADHNRAFFTNENIGRIFGTGLGAYVGSQVGKGRGNDVAIAAGAVGGYMLGGKVGRQWNSGHKQHSSGYSKSNGGSKKGYLYPVQAMPELEQIDATYYATQTSNVRGGPSTRYVIVEGLRPGEQVRVLGRVVDKNWYLVAQDDIIQGFVHMSLLEPTESYVSYSAN